MQKLLSYITEIHQEFPQDENFSLNKSAVADYSILTTSKNGHRSRYSSGIFLPKFCLSSSYQVFLDTFRKAEFVEWLISRNKPSNRTNKASRFFAVVETISHPLQGGNLHFLLNKENIKMPTIKHPAVADFPQNMTACDCTKQHEFLYETTNIAQKMQEKLHKSCNPEQKTILPAVAVIGYPLGVVAKSTTSREKLNDLTLANDSTPLTRAFFVRSLRTPKIRYANLHNGIFSMVGRIGQSLVAGCVPKFAVSHPDTSYRPAVRSQAVALKSNFGAITMLFKFLVLGDKRLTISIRAKSEAEARQKLQFTSPALCVARYNTSRSRTNKGGIYA